MIARLRVGFALTTALGNSTRFENLRRLVDVDSVEPVWAPLRHWVGDEANVPLPVPVLHHRALLREATPVLRRWHELDVVVVHAFQLYAHMVLRRQLRGGPRLVVYQDYAPLPEGSLLRAYGQDITDGPVRRARFETQAWFARRADAVVAWTAWAARGFVQDARVHQERVHVISPGVDLSLWPFVEPPRAEGPTQLLFVGGDFTRKGGDLLLEVLPALQGEVELDVVTRDPHVQPAPGVRVHRDLSPNDGRLRRLYGRCDALVVPTRADMAGLVYAEAMATGRPVIGTTVGGVPDMVEHGVSGLVVEPDDPDGLVTAIRALRDPARRRQMGEAGRRRVETEFDAAANTRRLVDVLRSVVAEGGG